MIAVIKKKAFMWNLMMSEAKTRLREIIGSKKQQALQAKV